MIKKSLFYCTSVLLLSSPAIAMDSSPRLSQLGFDRDATTEMGPVAAPKTFSQISFDRAVQEKSAPTPSLPENIGRAKLAEPAQEDAVVEEPEEKRIVVYNTSELIKLFEDR